MTIKELEAQVNMTRANIRFYEQEGLLSPARSENGYRDYSPADVDTLEKIKLFRSLHLDLDTIRSLQAGETTLEAALSAQLETLENDQNALDRARQVCEQLKASGADYASLDARPWLEELERAPAPDSPRFAPPEDVPPRPAYMDHPWRRYFARHLDLSLYGVLLSAFSLLILHWRPPSNVFVSLVISYLGYGLMFLFEPLMLHFWGTTPGKAIFGISLRSVSGEKLSISAARRRLGNLFGNGMGYGIPIYSLYRMWKSSTNNDLGGVNDWEWDEDSYLTAAGRYTFSDTRAWRCWGCVGGYVLCFALTFLVVAQFMMPPHHGAADQAEFFENYNACLKRVKSDARPLGADGQLTLPESDANTVVVHLPSTVYGTSYGFLDWSFTEEAGAVTGVTLAMDGTGDVFLPGTAGGVDQGALLLAFVLGQPEANAFTFFPTVKAWSDLLEDVGWNYTLTRDGVTVTQTAEFTGTEYDPKNDGSSFVFANDGGTGTLHLTYTITKEEPS